MNLTSLLGAFGASGSIPLAALLELFAGNPVSIPVQPLSEQVLGKTLTVSLGANALQLQLK